MSGPPKKMSPPATAGWLLATTPVFSYAKAHFSSSLPALAGLIRYSDGLCRDPALSPCQVAQSPWFGCALAAVPANVRPAAVSAASFLSVVPIPDDTGSTH